MNKFEQIFFAHKKLLLSEFSHLSLIDKIDNKEKRDKLLTDIEVMVKRDISMFLRETVYETKSLQGKMKRLIETPEKNLTAEETKIKEMMIYFLYLIKTEAE